MPLILPHTGDLLFRPAWACLPPGLSAEPAEHKASLIRAASSLLGQEMAQDNFSLDFGVPEQRPPGFEGPARVRSGPLSHLFGAFATVPGCEWEFPPRPGQQGGEKGRPWFSFLLGIKIITLASNVFLYLQVFSLQVTNTCSLAKDLQPAQEGGFSVPSVPPHQPEVVGHRQ